MAESRGRVLVVDDNRVNRQKLSMMLAQQGHEVRLAEDGQRAMELLRQEPFDVVLLDILMPEMDGYQVLEQMKSEPTLRDIPVIVISALDEIDSVVRCIQMGAEDYLPKSFNPVLLRARLDSSLQKKRLRDLEKMYLQQDLVLRQNEKLATLGKLSAGMAHELNNPAAAVQRGASHMREALQRLQQAQVRLGESNLSSAQSMLLANLDALARERARASAQLDALARSDLESELELWLDQRGVQRYWDVAPIFVDLGLLPADLAPLADSLTPEQLAPAVEWLQSGFTARDLVGEIGEGARRVSEIVKALKSYSYMDQAPLQAVNVHEGLENTLIILRSKLRGGITVRRDYAEPLPELQAYGSELNQVWTNLLDNAIDALNGSGEIVVRTRSDAEWLIVAIEDNGPGIPEAIQSSIFDPFFTTKAPGQGTGLGLNISYNIVTHKHHGRIEVSSRPGCTRFEVRLPVQRPVADIGE